MGRRDKLTKNYMRNPEKFADFFNGFIYDGQEVINWKDLQEVDPTSLINIPLVNSKKSLTVQKIRDIIKSAIVMKDGEKYFVLLGIENQSDVHYAMPVRTMLYNALTYAEQVELISKNRVNQHTDSAAFLKIDRETAEIMGEFTDIRLTKKDKEGLYNMCKAVEEIKAKSIAEGIVKGETKGTLDTLISLVRDGLLDIEEAAKRANMQLKDFEEKVNSNDNN